MPAAQSTDQTPPYADPDRLAAMTLAELRAEAAEADVVGRSRMGKAELVEALSQPLGRPTLTRVDTFRELAEARARGETVFLPRYLTGLDRRRHVRQTIREDHETRIEQGSNEAEAKFDKLAGSLFSFFRGTALLFYRDMAGEDVGIPTVLTLGDVHPENYGVMPSSDDVPIFGVNASTRRTTRRSPGTSSAARWGSSSRPRRSAGGTATSSAASPAASWRATSTRSRRSSAAPSGTTRCGRTTHRS